MDTHRFGSCKYHSIARAHLLRIAIITQLWTLLQDPRDISRKIPADRFEVDNFFHPEATHHGTTNATRGYFLDQDISHFDAGFFHIHPTESDAIDPQQRILMEVIYDSLCAAGLPMEGLRGSSTAVYVGMMCDDWAMMVASDQDAIPTYAATGAARSIVANRVSYFFDWHGPSMTIDTACSSSLVALHHAVQTLRSGESSVAVAAGTSLLLSPSESNLRMLSPKGRCAMWDEAADGYARGEGVAAVVLKTLSQALADGDPIECIIRETGVNQDGLTTGLTMPNHSSQAALIRETYRKAGLDLNNPSDRPQFFHAHGTGTPAGDPQEAEAISVSLFPKGSPHQGPLYVGSIKTIIGHTEGTAGLASLLGTILAMKHNTVPPNLHFTSLSKRVAPFCTHLEIPTVPQPWPTLREGQVKRASVNSFGFGGTNAHAIIESFSRQEKKAATSGTIFTPLVFSAASAKALQNTLIGYNAFLQSLPTVDLRGLAWTLQTRTSTFPYRKFIVGADFTSVSTQLEVAATDVGSDDGTRYSTITDPKVLLVFTGQGAQWPRMGARLVEQSSFVRDRLNELDGVLQELPMNDRPTWNITTELLADKDHSNLSQATLSQPLCLAIQVVLVDILRGAGIQSKAVVGHSSGEIAAAYAAGYISAADAIRIAYYRGLHAQWASSKTAGARGAMMAASLSYEEAQELVRSNALSGRVQLAAVNSSSSVTLSGDEEGIDLAISMLQEKQTFTRKLRVDKAYHSAHMAPCAPLYQNSLDACGGLVTNAPKDLAWFSTVDDGRRVNLERLTSQYWVDNMCNPVLFSSAVTAAVSGEGPFDLVIEVGPHPALKAPVTSILEELGSEGQTQPPYVGMLSRHEEDDYVLASALGSLWTILGPENINLDSVERLLSSSIEDEPPCVVPDRPLYPFDHHRSYWLPSRVSNYFKYQAHPPNPLLGSPCSIGKNAAKEFQWRNILRPREVPWVMGHRIQGQIVFPATGYVAMAVEALRQVASTSEIGSFEIVDLEIGLAISCEEEETSVEILFSLSAVEITDKRIAAEFTCCSSVSGSGNARSSSTTHLNAKGLAFADLGVQSSDILPVGSQPAASDLVNVDPTLFYRNLAKLGYQYSSPFQGVTSIRRKPGYSTGLLEDQSGTDWENQLAFHPAMLDTALQTAFAAWSFPGDGLIWSLHIPTRIRSVVLNPHWSDMGIGRKQRNLQYESFISHTKTSTSNITADVQIYTGDRLASPVRIEGIALVPITPASPADDIPIFSNFHYSVACPNGQLPAMKESLSDLEVQMYRDIDRASFWYIRQVAEEIQGVEREGLLPHLQHYLSWCDRIVAKVARGELPKVPPECAKDRREDVVRLLSKYDERNDVKFVSIAGEHLVEVIREGKSILEYLNQGNLMMDVYENGFAAGPYNRWLGRMMAQITHRYPRMDVLEIGAGSGATTRSILSQIGTSMNTYTFTDVSSGFFPAAQEHFKQYSDKMKYQVFDIAIPPEEQGFQKGQYHIVVAANVLHVSADMEQTMANVRELVKPGGYILILEGINNEMLVSGMSMGTIPGWWVGAAESDDRLWGPYISLDRWDQLLQKTGFSGIDAVAPDLSESLPVCSFLAQAVDERVSILRRPLSNLGSPLYGSSTTKNLAIIGGRTIEVFNLVEEISSLLLALWETIVVFDSVEEFVASEMSSIQGTNVLSLTDLDEPFLKEQWPSKFESLKSLLHKPDVVLWVTRGCRKTQPYSYMMIGIGRTIYTESTRTALQFYDLEDMGDKTAQALAVAIMRVHLLRTWGLDSSALLWSLEPEVIVQDGYEYIPRLLPNKEKNDRYNSQKRVIRRTVHPRDVVLQLIPAGPRMDIQILSPLRVSPQYSTTLECRTIRLTFSLLQSIRIRTAGFFRPCLGYDVDSGEPVLALSPSAECPAHLPVQYCQTVASLDDPVTFLTTIGCNVLADSIMSLVPQSGTLVMHEAESPLISSILSHANGKRVKTVFTSAKPGSKSNNCVVIHPRSSGRVVKGLLPSKIDVFVHISGDDASLTVGNLIKSVLPPGCQHIDRNFLISNHAKGLVEGAALDEISALLTKARCPILPGGLEPSRNLEVEVIPIVELPSTAVSAEGLAIIDWAGESVSALVQPIDTGIIFKPNRTYFLVGLAGEIGQSLGKWMVEHGARYVVLASRTPKVTQEFIITMAEQGAMVKVLSIDVTKRKSLREGYGEISRSMPPIVGVVNGAMVLQDSIFENMSLEQFQRVLRPKVEGTKLLDELFHDTPLDFFIATSSIIAAIGWTGQANYAAANLFMTALMYQRKQRGVPGSAIGIPAVRGIGYAAQGDNFDFDAFSALRYVPASEQDVWTLFAEAIHSGRPDSAEEAELQAGIDYMPTNLSLPRGHMRDIKLSHYMLDQNISAGPEDQGHGAQVKAQLDRAKAPEEIHGIIRDAFVTHLKRILQIPVEDSIEESVPLIELGIDSLVAVLIRTWFLKELDVDIPFLKILSGGSISTLLDATMASYASLATKGLTSTSSVTSAEECNTGSSSSHASSATYPLTPITPTSDDGDGSRVGLQMEVGSDSKKLTCHQPMSFGQARFWFLQEYLADKTSLNFSVSLCMRGPLRLDMFERAVEEVIGRHDALRLCFFWSDGDARVPLQGTMANSLICLEKKQVHSEQEAKQELDHLQCHVYDLEKGVTVRLLLLTISDTHHYFLIGCHHIALDGPSVQLLISELNTIYSGKGQSLASLPPHSQYLEFATQQRRAYESGAMESDLEFFRREIPKNPRPIDLFPFAKISSRMVMEQHKSYRATMRLQPTAAKRVKKVARRLGCTSFHVYLSVLQTLIWRLLPDTDAFFVGISDSNRVDQAFMNTLGCLINILPIKCSRDKVSQRLGDMIRTTRDRVFEALQHSKVPFDVLLGELDIERSGTSMPIFQIFMDYQLREQTHIRVADCDAALSWAAPDLGYDLSLEVMDTVAGESSISLSVQQSLYTEKHAQLLLRTFVHLLETFYSSSTREDTALTSLPLWAEEDVSRSMILSKGSPLELQWGPTVIHRIDEMVTMYPSNLAIKDDYGIAMTYTQVQERIGAIATRLAEVPGVGEGAVVGVFQEPSVDWICSLLAILRLGCTYLPLDSKNGMPRLITSVSIARPVVILVDQVSIQASAPLTDSGAFMVDVTEITPHPEGKRVPNQATADGIAVILFTSGSTGTPKGIQIRNSSLIGFTEGFLRAWGIGQHRVLQQTTFSFDPSMIQIFTALAQGGSLHVASFDQRSDGAKIARLMLDERITFTVSTPTECRLWLQAGAHHLQHCSSWQWVITGGEPQQPSLLEGLSTLALPQLRLYDMYGPAELSMGTTMREVLYRTKDTNSGQSSKGGILLPNYSAYILDDDLKPVPVGVSGEIVGGGPGVAAGYLADSRLAQQGEAFITRHFPDDWAEAHLWTHLYRTGDRGHMEEDGTLVLEGRIDGDSQVKIHGVRVELEEIEKVILRTSDGAVSEAVVCLSSHSDGKEGLKYLIGYVVPSPTHKHSATDGYLAHLLSQLPLAAYMKPSRLIPVNKIPINAHGKIDRRSLSRIPIPEVLDVNGTLTCQSTSLPPLSDMETQLVDLWRRVLSSDLEGVRSDSDFFGVGGNSMGLANLQRLIDASFSVKPKLSDILGCSQLSRMANLVDEMIAREENHEIDWEVETAIPEPWLIHMLPSTASNVATNGPVVVLTGATGYIGGHLLSRLAQDKRVSRVICLVREGTPWQFTDDSDKVTTITADLGKPGLDLSFEAFSRLTEEADLIVHCAANRHFWDDYRALRSINIGSVKELVRMALPRRVPLHFFSSSAVHQMDADEARRDNGYMASKWAAECLLEKVAQRLRLPVYIHRLNCAPSDIPLQADPNVVKDFIEYAMRLGHGASFESIQGHVDLIPSKQFTDQLHAALLESLVRAESTGTEHGTVFPLTISYNSHIRLDISHARGLFDEDQTGWNDLPMMDVLPWTGAVKKLGLPYVFASHELTMLSSSGNLVSRR
ncbi:hypothetical protein BBP40_006993 [Aspergillus hancockii]|nr:hypothetical protein BBP40_006993 [Aspergillus hancockii]